MMSEFGVRREKAALSSGCTAPSWRASSVDRAGATESLFVATFNGLLQQNLPGADVLPGVAFPLPV
jgi:hypothetical protein